MERVLRLPNGELIDSGKKIDRLLKERKSILELRKKTPPTEVLKGINLEKAIITRNDLNLIGNLEVGFRGKEPFVNPLFEIPDIQIDLTPKAGALPRKNFGFTLSDESKAITISVLFNETYHEYWEHYGNEEKVQNLVLKNLMQVLHESDWQCDWTGAWFAAQRS
jgi:hypothetical protein